MSDIKQQRDELEQQRNQINDKLAKFDSTEIGTMNELEQKRSVIKSELNKIYDAEYELDKIEAKDKYNKQVDELVDLVKKYQVFALPFEEVCQLKDSITSKLYRLESSSYEYRQRYRKPEPCT